MGPRRRLLRHGLVLFLVGLVTGLAVPAFKNPRIAVYGGLGVVVLAMLYVLGTFVLSTWRAQAE